MRRDGGQITVVTIGLLVVVGLLMVVVVNASAAFLERRELLNLADRAALRAVDGLALDSVYREGVGDALVLDIAAARARAAEVLPADARLTLTVNGDTVHVRLDRSFTMPVRPPGWSGEVGLVAEASARLQLTSDVPAQ